MTEFITRGCHAERRYEIIIKTDNEEHYYAAQAYARLLIGHQKPQTNAARIRAMNDEELAEWLCGVYDDDNCGVYQDEVGKFINGTTIIDYDQYKILEWLKQPAEEE